MSAERGHWLRRRAAASGRCRATTLPRHRLTQGPFLEDKPGKLCVLHRWRFLLRSSRKL
jgi:hypothetical protein